MLPLRAQELGKTLGETSPSCRLWPRIMFGNAGQNHWRTVGKLGDQRKIPAHGLDRFSERGQQEIAPPFEARNTVLGDPERLSHLYLGKLARVPQFAQGHFLGDQLSGAGLGLLALSGAQSLHFVLQRDWHGYALLFLIRDRCSFVIRQGVEFGIEVLMEFNFPLHSNSMSYK